jgi:hypothetical protein
MKQLAFSNYSGLGDDSAEVVAKDSATSMGPNGWNPNPT